MADRRVQRGMSCNQALNVVCKNFSEGMVNLCNLSRVTFSGVPPLSWQCVCFHFWVSDSRLCSFAKL